MMLIQVATTAPGVNFRVRPVAEKARAAVAKLAAGFKDVAARAVVVGVRPAGVAALGRRNVPARTIRSTIRAAHPSNR